MGGADELAVLVFEKNDIFSITFFYANAVVCGEFCKGFSLFLVRVFSKPGHLVCDLRKIDAVTLRFLMYPLGEHSRRPWAVADVVKYGLCPVWRGITDSAIMSTLYLLVTEFHFGNPGDFLVSRIVMRGRHRATFLVLL